MGPTRHSCPYYDIVSVTAERKGLAKCHSGYQNTTVPLWRGASGSKALLCRHSRPEGCLPFTVVSQLWGFFREKRDLSRGARDSRGKAAEQQVLASWDGSVRWNREGKDGEGGGEGEMMRLQLGRQGILSIFQHNLASSILPAVGACCGKRKKERKKYKDFRNPLDGTVGA